MNEEVIVTGYPALIHGGERVNPALEVARALDGQVVAGHTVQGVELPNVFAAVPGRLRQLAATEAAVILCLGVHAGSATIAVERLGANRIWTQYPDDAGETPQGVPVVDGGPPAYWSSLPVDPVVARLLGERIPATDSQAAGTHLCNAALYSLMHVLATLPDPAVGGFIHLPLLPEQVARHGHLNDCRPSMDLRTMVTAVRLALEESLTRAG